MPSTDPDKSSLPRRNFLQMVAAGARGSPRQALPPPPGYRCERLEEIRPAIEAALRSPRPALVDANEKPANPDELRV